MSLLLLLSRTLHFSRVSSEKLRQLQDSQANLKLSSRLQTWADDSGRRAPQHVLAMIQQQITEILADPTSDTGAAAFFKSCVRKLMQDDVFLLQVDCESAGELHDSILTAISSAPQETFQGIFVVSNRSQTARDKAAASLDLLLDNAASIAEVQYTTQNLNASEGRQLAPYGTNSLKNILLNCKIQSDAMTHMLHPHISVMQAMFSPDTPHPDIITAAVAYLVRDKHAKPSTLATPLPTRVLYTPDCDTMTCLLLRKYLHGDKFVPGITGVSAEMADRISGCIKVAATAQGQVAQSFNCAGLREIARDMPASSVWAQTLLDLLHAVDHDRAVISGVNTPTLILSQFLSSTLQHHEDLSAGALNILVAGQPKLWVSLSDAANYDQLLERGVGCTGSRDKKVMRSFHSVLDGDGQHINMFVQYSGLTVYTVVGHKWHQTLSLGTNVAESMNHWIGLESTTPDLLSAVSSIASDLVALSDFQAAHAGWPESYRHMAAAYFPDWELCTTRAEAVTYIKSVLAGLGSR